MGLLRSVGRFVRFFLCCKLDDDEEEDIEKRFRPHPTLPRWHQNQHYSSNAERSPLLYPTMSRKDPIPILPVRYPVPTIFKSNDPSSKGKGQFKEELVTVKNRVVVVEEGQWKNVERSPLLYPRKDPIPVLPVQSPVPTILKSNDPSSKRKGQLKEEVTAKTRVVEEGRLTNVQRSTFLYHGKPIKDPIPVCHVQKPAPTIFTSNDPSSKGKEKLKEVMTGKGRVVEEGRLTNAERSPFLYLFRPRKDPLIPILPVQNPVPTIFRSNYPSSKGKEKLKEVMTGKSRVAEEGWWRNVESSLLLYPRGPRKDPILPVKNPLPNFFRNNDPSPKGKEKLKEDQVIIVKNRVVVVDEGRWIKHYSSRHRILLVGEGDFSFSAALAVAFGSASNIIATSLNSIEFLKKHYGSATSNMEKLRSRGCQVMHGIDATQMANHSLLAYIKFDRIIFNFPFAGFFPGLSTQSQLGRHRSLVSMFLKNAKEMVKSGGEIHITHKTNGFHKEWKLESIASSHGLNLIEAVEFKHLTFPGYNPKYGFGGDGNFNCYPSNTYKFGLQIKLLTPSSQHLLNFVP